MTEAHANARATLAAIASSPDAVAASQAHLFAAVDALVAVYATPTQDMQPRQAAMRSPRAAWASVLAHAEHRIASLKRAEAKP